MRNIKQQGFTLIELVMVIVILGILAATALPKFVNLQGDAYAAAAQGYAGALNSANAVNYSACAARNGVAAAGVCVKVTKCSDLKDLINPAITFTIGAIPGTTTAKTFYMATDDASTATGTTCTAKYGDGAAGQAFTFIATTT